MSSAGRFATVSLRRRATVAIVSDTHGFLDHRVARLVAGCDAAVHAGDIGGVHVLRGLEPRSGHVLAVRGNNDTEESWEQDEHGVLAALSAMVVLELAGGTLVVEHGHRVRPARERHERLRRRHPGARVIAYGHTHRQVCDTDGEPWVVNPGAAGRARTFGGPSALVLHAGPRRWRIEPVRFEPRRPGTGKAS